MITGSLITLFAVIYPVYKEVSRYEQPVALFETILSDLDRGYVDEVNTQKLFETGVSAMLRSLDPYTEYYDVATDIQESVSGKYAGVGLVISGPNIDSAKNDNNNNDDNDNDNAAVLEEGAIVSKKKNRGINVVNAFEGYAFDQGIRIGDRIVAVDDVSTEDKTSDQVRNMLRGDPGTDVKVSYVRGNVEGITDAIIPRKVVQIPDVKCVAMLDPNKSVGYIQLSGFSGDAGREVRNAIVSLQERGFMENRNGLQGLVLDLRGNPGGLLTSAVDVSSAFVPRNSDIVSARGRGFPGVTYRSRVDPLLSPDVKLVVLTNGQTASAAEIVSGAIQDLDVGVILGTGKTYGKGLVQNVEELPFNRAMKFTVAKYYTPSGRCIQSVNYKEGGGLNAADASFTSSKVNIKDQNTYFTKAGRPVKDGVGIEADYKVDATKASALEVTLLREGLFYDFANEWSKSNTINDNYESQLHSDELYNKFISFVETKQKAGDIQLDAIYKSSMDELKKALKASGYSMSENELNTLRTSILKDVRHDFQKYKSDIQEDIGQNILSRYLPERLLIQRSIRTDVQVSKAVDLIKNGGQFDALLARDNTVNKKSNIGRELASTVKTESMTSASNSWTDAKDDGKILFHLNF